MDVIFDIIATEEKRQREGLELIPSENYVSRDVLAAMGSVLTNKYSEGYPDFDGLTTDDEATILASNKPDRRYYGGQQNTDKVERLAIARACKLFHADHANVQPHSGAQANNAVYNAWLEPGDMVLGTEGDGLAHKVIAEADYVARIPMQAGVDSLNVAAASAVAFWQLRGEKGN